MKKFNKQPEANVLSDAYTRLIEFPNEVRDAICSECGFSLPTFYRKMRTADKKNQFGKTIPALSNAEKGMIIKVVFGKLSNLVEYFNNYRKKDG